MCSTEHMAKIWLQSLKHFEMDAYGKPLNSDNGYVPKCSKNLQKSTTIIWGKVSDCLKG